MIDRITHQTNPPPPPPRLLIFTVFLKSLIMVHKSCNKKMQTFQTKNEAGSVCLFFEAAFKKSSESLFSGIKKETFYKNKRHFYLSDGSKGFFFLDDFFSVLLCVSCWRRKLGFMMWPFNSLISLHPDTLRFGLRFGSCQKFTDCLKTENIHQQIIWRGCRCNAHAES